jgi:hypothetical protein
MLRVLGGVVLGAAAAALAWLAIALFGDTLFPSPADARAPSGLEAFAAAPSPAKLFLLAATLAASIAGGAVAKTESGRSGSVLAVTAFVTAVALLSVLLVRLPPWMIVALVLAATGGGVVANHLVAKHPPEFRP